MLSFIDGWMLALWIVSAVAATATTVRWFVKFGSADVRRAMICTTLAGVPGVAFCLECLVRWAISTLSDAGFRPLDYPTYAFAGLWIAVGPLLMIVGFILRAIADEIPRGTAVVQGLHVLMWCWSSLLALWFLLMVL